MLLSTSKSDLLAQCGTYKGMLGELGMRAKLLRERLLRNAEDIDQVEKELLHLEDEMDIISMSSDSFQHLETM
jgi:hypothetical protein